MGYSLTGDGRLCAAGEHCKGYRHDTNMPEWATTSPLCAECLSSHQQSIRGLVYDYRDLEQLIPIKSKGANSPITGSKPKTIPINLEVESLQSLIHYSLTLWEEVIRDHCDLAPQAQFVRPGYAVQMSATVLSTRVSLIARLGATVISPLGCEDELVEYDGIDALNSLSELHYKARKLLGLTRWVDQLPGYCSACNLECLRRNSDQPGIVYCAACGDWKTREDYHREVMWLIS